MKEGRGSRGFQDINQYLTTKSHWVPRAKAPLFPSWPWSAKGTGPREG